MLVGVAVRDQTAAPFSVAVMIGRGRLDEGIGQHPLKGLPGDRAGRESTGQCVRVIARDGLDMDLGERRVTPRLW